MSEALFSCPDTFYRHFDRKGGQQWTTHYCPGCGHGLVHKYVAQAIDDLGVQDRSIFVSPVGCAVFGYYYFDVGNVQVAHGRCPAAATALKRAQDFVRSHAVWKHPYYWAGWQLWASRDPEKRG